MLKGDYKCPYCGDVCNEQGIKRHMMNAHPLHVQEFGYDHLNKFPVGHKEHAKETEKILDAMYNDKETADKLDELLVKESEAKKEKGKDNDKNKNVFEQQEEEKEKQKITKEELLGVTQTNETPQQTITIFECGNCGAQVTQEMQVCPNCGAPLNWQDVE
jgi:DNA-directed RNA polymerase subunit RPC12/RpoP